MDEKHLVKFLWVVKACLLAVLLYTSIEVVASRLHPDVVLPPGIARGTPRAADPQIAPPPTRSPPDYAMIVQRNLFGAIDKVGNSQAGAPPSQTPDSPLPTEELDLRLIGAIAGGPVASRAIIQDGKSKAAGPYRIGDTVAGATVETIQRDAVVLRYQGQPLVLKLGAGKTSNEGSRAQGAGQEADSQKPPSSLSRPAATQPSTAEYVAEVFRRATIEPYVKNQRTEGLKISGLEQFPLAEVFGLKNGDVIAAINGQQLTSKQKAFQVLMKARTQPQVHLQVLRDGQSKELSFDL